MLGAAEQAGEEVVRGQVLERVEALAERAHLVGRQVAAFAVEARDRLAHAEVARRPGAGPREVAGEEPVGRPLADPRQRGQRGLDLVVGQAARARPRSRSLRARPIDVLGLAAREAERDSSSGSARGQPLARRERVGVLGADAEALDQPVANREGGVERDLLRGDRRDEALERLDRDRRPEAAELGRRDGRGPARSRRRRRTRRGRTRRPAACARPARSRRRAARRRRRRAPR